jgi:hypothetical protein
MKFTERKISDTYEGLLTQYKAACRILDATETRIAYLQKQIQRFDVSRIIELESELESEREMNHLLTQELENKNRYEK